MIFIKKKLRFIIFVLIFIIISPLVVLYAKGDIFANGWNILATGGIYVTAAPIDAEVFLNLQSEGTVSFFERNILLKNLRPGTYTVRVQKDNYNTWSDTIVVHDNIVSNADVFMLMASTTLDAIPKYIFFGNGTSSLSVKEKNPQYISLLAAFASSSLPISIKVPVTSVTASSTIDFKDNLGTKYSPVMDGNIGLWQENNTVFAKWFGDDDDAPEYFCNAIDCTETIAVFHTSSAIRRINFLPNYDGVVVIAAGTKIFAIQIENNPNKKPQLIYQGKNPDFQILDGDLYIKDGTFLAQVIL